MEHITSSLRSTKNPVLPNGHAQEQDITQSEQARFQMVWDERMGHRNVSVGYDKTAVLLLSWKASHDDLEVEKEVEALGDVFREDYGFEVWDRKLSVKPQLQANKYLADFAEQHDGKKTLLIVYYAGHGFSDPDIAHYDIKLAGRLSPSALKDQIDRASITWSNVEWNIRNLESDVLLIFDCCFAGRLAYVKRMPLNNYELLGACSDHETTCSAGEKSFTSALIRSLQHLANESEPFSTARLRSTILNKEINSALPASQMPVLSDRFHHGKHIVIARQSIVEESRRAPPPLIAESQTPQLREYLTLTLHYRDSITEELVRHEADTLRRIMDGADDHKLKALHIAYQHKSSHAIDRWRTAWKQLSRSRAASANCPGRQPVTITLPASDEYNATSDRQVGVGSQLDSPSRSRSPISSMTAADETHPLLRSDGYENQPRTHETPMAFHLAAIARLLWWRLLNFLSWLCHMSDSDSKQLIPR